MILKIWAGVPPSRRGPAIMNISKKSYYPFIGQYASRLYPLHSDKWVIHVTPTLSNGCSTLHLTPQHLSLYKITELFTYHKLHIFIKYLLLPRLRIT